MTPAIVAPLAPGERCGACGSAASSLCCAACLPRRLAFVRQEVDRLENAQDSLHVAAKAARLVWRIGQQWPAYAAGCGAGVTLLLLLAGAWEGALLAAAFAVLLHGVWADQV